jgi:hypothetical protein
MRLRLEDLRVNCSEIEQACSHGTSRDLCFSCAAGLRLRQPPIQANENVSPRGNLSMCPELLKT